MKDERSLNSAHSEEPLIGVLGQDLRHKCGQGFTNQGSLRVYKGKGDLTTDLYCQQLLRPGDGVGRGVEEDQSRNYTFESSLGNR